MKKGEEVVSLNAGIHVGILENKILLLECCYVFILNQATL